MKSLKDYVYKESYEFNDDLLITEGFWKKLGSLLGFSSNKLGAAMKNWGSDLKSGFTTGQYIAAKSKDKDVKNAAKEQAEAAEKSPKELLEKVKLEVQRLMKVIDKIDIPDHALSQWNQLKTLSKQEKDEEGTKLAEKFKGIIDKRWPDGGKDYEKISKKVEKAGVADGPKEEGEKGEGEDAEAKEANKQAAEEATETIKDNVDLFKQLAKAAGINGEGLRDYVAKYVLTRGEDGKIKSKDEIAKISDDEVLATCIIVCGAAMTKNDETFARIVKAIYKGKDGKNGLTQLMKLVKK
jgi:hypothetical protein